MASLLRHGLVVVLTVGVVLGAALVTTWAAAVYRSWPCTLVVPVSPSDRHGTDLPPCPGL